MRRFVDLSHVIRDGQVTYPGLPAPEISVHLDRETSAERHGPDVRMEIGRICMVANTGTYIDVPYHYYADRRDLAGYPLERLVALDALVLDVSELIDAGRRAIGASDLAGVDVAGKAVLLRTGWDRHFGTDVYGVEAPFLAADGVQWMVDNGAVIVGIDSVNIDDIGDLSRPAHSGLLANEICIVEHLVGLDQLPDSGFSFTAAPAKVAAMGTFPVRAFATVGA
jgi:arylformamidase